MTLLTPRNPRSRAGLLLYTPSCSTSRSFLSPSAPIRSGPSRRRCARCGSATASSSAARASWRSPRRCCSRASPMSAAIRARRSRIWSTCWSKSQDLLDELGVHLETCTNEASAAAMLGASINYPMRGCVTWKSIVGTNVAADALSNLASPGVIGGALIVVGEDYGEGASVIQERTHAYALKSSIWLLDPRPIPADHRALHGEGVRAVRGDQHAGHDGAAHPRLPCHRRVRREGQQAPAISRNHRLANPAAHNYDRISHPPSTYRAREDQGRGPPARGRARSSSSTASTSSSPASAPISASSCRAASPTS